MLISIITTNNEKHYVDEKMIPHSACTTLSLMILSVMKDNLFLKFHSSISDATCQIHNNEIHHHRLLLLSPLTIFNITSISHDYTDREYFQNEHSRSSEKEPSNQENNKNTILESDDVHNGIVHKVFFITNSYRFSRLFN